MLTVVSEEPVTATQCTIFRHCTYDGEGHAVAQLTEALRYKPEGRCFDSRCYHWIFSLT